MSYPASLEGLVYASLKGTLSLPCRERMAIAVNQGIPAGQMGLDKP
jgi:hypothetical protein